MAKLGSYTNPLTGKSGSVTNVGGMASMVVGVIVLLATFGIGSFLFNKLKNMVPGTIGAAMGANNVLNPAPGAQVVTNAGPTVTLWK